MSLLRKIISNHKNRVAATSEACRRCGYPLQAFATLQLAKFVGWLGFRPHRTSRLYKTSRRNPCLSPKFRVPCAGFIGLLAVTVIFLLVVIPATSSGRGIIPIGGSPVVGVSANWLCDDVTRPVPPLNSILMDETWQSLFPIGQSSPLATLETTESGKIHISIASNIVWADAPSRIMTSSEVINNWTNRALERWDAKWALRGIESMAAVDENTIELSAASGFSRSDLERSLRNPALRLTSGTETAIDGSGPFLTSQPSQDRKRFTTSLTHFAGRPYLDEVSIISYLSAEESVLDFGRGSLDALLITSNERDIYVGSSRAVPGRIESVGQGLIILLFNPAGIPELNERLALASSVDRDSIASLVLGTGAVVASDFEGNPAPTNETGTIADARELYESVIDPQPEITLLVCDDPAARSTAGRLRANWENLGVPVQINELAGPLSLSSQADAILISVRIPIDGEGVLPECLTLYDRNGWWEIAELGMATEDRPLLQSVRNLEPSADLNSLGTALEGAGLMIPIARFDILFAPGPDIVLVPDEVYPGTVFWRAYMGSPGILNAD
jgi:hypothetical protein